MLSVKDVTDQNNYQKAKIQNKYKSMALYTLSHELRTPVHSIDLLISYFRYIKFVEPNKRKNRKRSSYVDVS